MKIPKVIRSAEQLIRRIRNGYAKADRPRCAAWLEAIGTSKEELEVFTKTADDAVIEDIEIHDRLFLIAHSFVLLEESLAIRITEESTP